MKVANLKAVTSKKRKVYTKKNTDEVIAKILLEQKFKAQKPNLVWVGDITYVPTKERMLYLASFVDVNSRKIVGWSMDINMDDNLVVKALMQAKDRENPEKGLIIHTDRGAQYTSRNFQQLIKEFDFISSMSRPGNCYDNALMESVNGTIKKELVYQSEFATVKQAKTELFKYIEMFYNRERLHSKLGYRAPVEYEKQLQ